jgi:hypothetical protein
MRLIRRVVGRWLLGVVLLAAGPAVGGCASSSAGGVQGFTMNTSPKLPDAEARVKVRVDATGDHIVEVAFRRLAPAPRAFEGATMYMVWLVPASAPPQPIGSLDVGDQLSAQMTIRTPNENFDVLVTAEINAYATTPSRNRAFVVAIRPAV